MGTDSPGPKRDTVLPNFNQNREQGNFKCRRPTGTCQVGFINLLLTLKFPLMLLLELKIVIYKLRYQVTELMFKFDVFKGVVEEK